MKKNPKKFQGVEVITCGFVLLPTPFKQLGMSKRIIPMTPPTENKKAA